MYSHTFSFFRFVFRFHKDARRLACESRFRVFENDFMSGNESRVRVKLLLLRLMFVVVLVAGKLFLDIINSSKSIWYFVALLSC